MFKKIILLLSILLLSSACGIFTPVTLPKVYYYVIDLPNQASHDDTCQTTSDRSLQITRMQAITPFDSNKMVYSTSKYELAEYAYNKWSATPNNMLTATIEEYLAKSCLYKSVVSSDFMTTASLRLNTRLLELTHVVTDDKSAKVDLAISVQLVDNASNTVIKSKTFVETVDAQVTPESFANQANAANQIFLQDLVNWLKQ